MATTQNTYSKLHSTLAASKTQKENNALFQTITNLINSLQTVQTTFNNAVTQIQALIGGFRLVQVVEFDTNVSAFTIDLLSYIDTGFFIFKDIGGNASVNNITLTGTVEGTVNPVINTNYGIYRVYKSTFDGNYYQW